MMRLGPQTSVSWSVPDAPLRHAARLSTPDLEEVVRNGSQPPFGVTCVHAATHEASQPSDLLDVTKHRLDGLGSSFVQRPAGRRGQTLAHPFGDGDVRPFALTQRQGDVAGRSVAIAQLVGVALRASEFGEGLFGRDLVGDPAIEDVLATVVLGAS